MPASVLFPAMRTALPESRTSDRHGTVFGSALFRASDKHLRLEMLSLTRLTCMQAFFIVCFISADGVKRTDSSSFPSLSTRTHGYSEPNPITLTAVPRESVCTIAFLRRLAQCMTMGALIPG